jgi:hypothetical protein
MKKQTKYLDFYYKCMATGEMDHEGLCYNFKTSDMEVFVPDFDECHTYDIYTLFWASEVYGRITTYNERIAFNQLRQNHSSLTGLHE